MGKDLQNGLRLPKGFYKFIVAKRINETQTLAGRGNNIIINIWIILIRSGDKREVLSYFQPGHQRVVVYWRGEIRHKLALQGNSVLIKRPLIL